MSDDDAGSVDETAAESGAEVGTEELLSQLGLIEDQPLDARAGAYAQVHDQLVAILEGGESRR